MFTIGQRKGLPGGSAQPRYVVDIDAETNRVIVGGAELFTGDTLMTVAYASRRITFSSLLRAWFLVYLGNILGGLGTVALMLFAEHYRFGDGAIGKTALASAFAADLHRSGATVLYGRCDEALSAAYQPFSQALSSTSFMSVLMLVPTTTPRLGVASGYAAQASRTAAAIMAAPSPRPRRSGSPIR